MSAQLRMASEYLKTQCRLHRPEKTLIYKCRPYDGHLILMATYAKDGNDSKRWESVHVCPKCSHKVSLGEIDLRVIATGMIVCPSCSWSGPVRIEVIERRGATNAPASREETTARLHPKSVRTRF